MAFMHFGNFLEGMRLSAQDIADKEKAALNERYMNEQMATMQLSRRMNEDELGYRPQQRSMEEARFANDQEQFAIEQRARRIESLRGEALSGLADLDLTDANALNRALTAHAKQAEYNGLPAQYAGWSARDAGKGVIELVSPDGTATRMDKRSASIFGHRLWNEIPEWKKTEDEIRRARAAVGAGKSSKVIDTSLYKDAGVAELKYQTQLSELRKNPKLLTMEVDGLAMDREDAIKRLQQLADDAASLRKYLNERRLHQRREDDFDPTIDPEDYANWRKKRSASSAAPAVAPRPTKVGQKTQYGGMDFFAVAPRGSNQPQYVTDDPSAIRAYATATGKTTRQVPLSWVAQNMQEPANSAAPNVSLDQFLTP